MIAGQAGRVDSSMTANSRGHSADIANLVAFLVSEDGRWVNGQVIRANGVIGAKPRATDQGFHECEARREAPR